MSARQVVKVCVWLFSLTLPPLLFFWPMAAEFHFGIPGAEFHFGILGEPHFGPGCVFEKKLTETGDWSFNIWRLVL